MNSCKNCFNNFTGKFCNHCGQKVSVSELNLHDLSHEAWHSFTHTDSGILRLLKDLFLHPKAVYLNYFSGQRKKYFSPVTFFLLTVGILLFVGIKVFDYQDAKLNTLNEFGRYSLLQTKFKFLILFPIQVLSTWLIFHKRYNLAKNIVFWLYLNGLLFTLKILLTPVYFILVDYKDNIDNIIIIVQSLVIYFHLILIFGNRKWSNFILLFVLTNFNFIMDNLIDGYMLFGNEMYKVSSTKNLFELIISLYTL